MKSMGFEAKKMRGTYKYIAVLADFDRQQRERKQDAAEDTIMPFWVASGGRWGISFLGIWKINP